MLREMPVFTGMTMNVGGRICEASLDFVYHLFGSQ